MASQHGFPNHTFWGSIVLAVPWFACPTLKICNQRVALKLIFVSWHEHKSGSGDRRKCTIRSMAQINHLQHFTTIPPFPNPMKYCMVIPGSHISPINSGILFVVHSTRGHQDFSSHMPWAATACVPLICRTRRGARCGATSYALMGQLNGIIMGQWWDNNGIIMG